MREQPRAVARQVPWPTRKHLLGRVGVAWGLSPLFAIFLVFAWATPASAQAGRSGQPVPPPPPPSQRFTCTGQPGVDNFTVPSFVTEITIDAIGGVGGTAADNAPNVGGTGGNAGHTVATVMVTPNEMLNVTVGCEGSGNGTGGFGAGMGGSGGTTGSNQGATNGAGGGGSGAVTGSQGTLAVAAGGGGGGGAGFATQAGDTAGANGGAGGAGDNPAGAGLSGEGPHAGTAGVGGNNGANLNGASGGSTSGGPSNVGGAGGGGGGGMFGGTGGGPSNGTGGDRGGSAGGGGGGMSIANQLLPETDATFKSTSAQFQGPTGMMGGDVILSWTKPTPTVTLSEGNPNPSMQGQTVSFTVAFTGAPSPTGEDVDLYEINPATSEPFDTPIGSCTLSATGTCTATASFSTTGDHTIIAEYGGDDATWLGARSNEVVQTVNAGPIVSFNPPKVAFPDQAEMTTSAPVTVTVTNTGGADLDITGVSIVAAGDHPNASAFSIVPGTNTCSGVILPGGTCTVQVTFTPPTFGDFTANLAFSTNALNQPQTVLLEGVGLPGVAYHALTPVRICDTRGNQGTACEGKTLGAGNTLNVQVTGTFGGETVPSDATAVTVNVTVTNTRANSFLTVFPTEGIKPLASNLNWLPNQTTSNLVQVQVGTGGEISLFNNVGNADVIIDLQGYYAPTEGDGGLFNPVQPFRAADTRAGSNEFGQDKTLGPGGSIDIPVTGMHGVPPTGDVSAVVLNLTGTNPTEDTYLTVWPTGHKPTTLASNLNLLPRETRPVRVIVPVGDNGEITVFNNVGETDVVVDVNAWFTSTAPDLTGTRFTAINPERIVDTRPGSGEGFAGSTLHGSTTLHVPVAGVDSVPKDAEAISSNVTTTNTTGNSFLTVYPDLTGRPFASDLNWNPTETNPNLTVVGVGTNGGVAFFNNVGDADLIVDVGGYYA